MQYIEQLETRQLLSASVAGSVFSDANSDGIRQATEVGLAGQQVYLDINGIGSYVATDPTATTDANGNYSFANLTAGNYLIRVKSIPTGYTQTNPLPIWGGNFFVQLADGQAMTGKDFGMLQNAVVPITSSIAGNIFSDVNSNGIKDSGDTGLVGQQVYLDLQGLGYFVANDPVAVGGEAD